MLAFKLSSHKVQSVWQQLQSTYLSQGSMYLLCTCPSPHDYIRPGFTNNCNNPNNVSHTWPACDTAKLFKFRSKKHKSKLTTKFPDSFQKQFKAVSTSYTVQVASNDSLHVPIKRNHNCSSNHGCYLMHLRNWDQRSQTGGVHMSPYSHSVVNQQSQHQVPLCLQCHDGSYLSLSALQYLYCQANNNASGFNLKVTSQCKHPSSSTVLARYRTSGVRLFTHYITNVATKPRSLTKQTRPSRFSCQTFSFQLSSPGMTPGSVAPGTVHSVRPGSTTTWPTCRNITLSYSTFLVWTYAAPCRPAHFLSNSFQWLTSRQVVGVLIVQTPHLCLQDLLPTSACRDTPSISKTCHLRQSIDKSLSTNDLTANMPQKWNKSTSHESRLLKFFDALDFTSTMYQPSDHCRTSVQAQHRPSAKIQELNTNDLSFTLDGVLSTLQQGSAENGVGSSVELRYHVEKAPCTDLRSDPTLHQNSYRTTQADAYVNHAHQTQAQSVNSQT